jgi:alkylation response protein AidB-like acyl-CoA dehydrogenase
MEMTQTDRIVADTTQRIFRELGDPQAIASSRDTAWQARLWTALEEAGLTKAWIEEALNGSGASLADGFDILKIAGSFAAGVPLAETLLAGWLLAQARMAVPDGSLTVAPVCSGDVILCDLGGALSGTARAVPFARTVDSFAVLAGSARGLGVALVPRGLCRITEAESVAGEPLDHVTFDSVRPGSIAWLADDFPADRLEMMGAAVRAIQMSGALEALLERTVAYANERVAFERPIGRFQAIQHAIARMAGEVAAALAAAGSAADAIASGACSQEALLLEVATAKIRAGEAANASTAIAHQIHGAIGFSQEHALHRYTQRLWAWRDDFGNESAWAVRLGKAAAMQGAAALWPWVAAR